MSIEHTHDELHKLGIAHIHDEAEEHDSNTHMHSDCLEHPHIHQNTKTVINRMNRIIGHLTATKGMVERGRDCSEVLIQLAAVRSALNGVCKIILKDHVDHCIVDAMETGDMETIKKLNDAIEMLLK